MTRILAICGSLRAASSNLAVLVAASTVAPSGLKVEIDRHVGLLPLFNPDLDRGAAPAVVTEFRAALAAADAVIICSPEYVHGVPGALKNALDWVVSSGEFMNKPVALISASAHATHARASLFETLRVMMGELVEEASITLALPSNAMTASQIAASPEHAIALRAALKALVGPVSGASRSAETPPDDDLQLSS